MHQEDDTAERLRPEFEEVVRRDRKRRGQDDQPLLLPWYIKMWIDMATLKRTPFTMVAWLAFVGGVIVHVLWACGLMVWLGFDAGFVRAADFNSQITKLAEATKLVQANTDRQLQLSLLREIREESLRSCATEDDGTREALQRYIDSLQQEYVAISNNGQRAPEARCQ